MSEEKRTEGVFADQSLNDEDDKHGAPLQNRGGKLNRVA